MRKQKLALLTFLVAIVSVCCLMFAAACNKTPKHAIKWTLDSQVTVKVADYEELPTELAEETVVNFTVEFATGYELKSISGAKEADNGYTFTVGKNDVEIKITAERTIKSLDVTNTAETYYAGDKIDAKTVSVKVNYEVGDPETVTGDKCTFNYQNGDGFSLGDTEYTVKYGKGSAKVELGEAIVGLVTLKLNGGVLSAGELAKLPEGYVLDTEAGIVSWTFAKAYESDYALPAPVLELPGSNLLLERWSGVENNKIVKGTDVSLTASAVYEAKLVEIKKMEFTSKSGVPYLVISGEFIAADSAYLLICNAAENTQYEKQPSVTKQADTNEFTLELNLADYAQSTPIKLDEDRDFKNSNPSFQGPWMDIRFCAKVGETVVQQELLVSDDITYASLDDAIIAVIGEEGSEKTLKFSYQTWTPAAGDPITGGNGAVFTGNENLLKLYFTTTTDKSIVKAPTLEKKTVEGKEAAYMVINGTHYYDTKEEAVEALTGYIFDMQNFTTWAAVDITDQQTITVNDDGTFKIELCLANIEESGWYVMHMFDSSTNYNPSSYDKDVEITIGNLVYSLTRQNPYGWFDWTCITVDDLSQPAMKMTSVALEQEGDSVYLVYSGTYRNYTEEELAAYAIDIEGGARKLLSLTVKLDEANGTFTMKADISDKETYPASGFYYMHGALLEEGQTLADLGSAANIKASLVAIVEGKNTVTANGFTYTLGEQWTTRGVTISEVVDEGEAE